MCVWGGARQRRGLPTFLIARNAIKPRVQRLLRGVIAESAIGAAVRGLLAPPGTCTIVIADRLFACGVLGCLDVPVPRGQGRHVDGRHTGRAASAASGLQIYIGVGLQRRIYILGAHMFAARAASDSNLHLTLSSFRNFIFSSVCAMELPY